MELVVMTAFGDVYHSFLEIPLPDPAERSVQRRCDDGDGDGDGDDDDGTDDAILLYNHES
jgi:hypothetical protein